MGVSAAQLAVEDRPYNWVILHVINNNIGTHAYGRPQVAPTNPQCKAWIANQRCRGDLARMSQPVYGQLPTVLIHRCPRRLNLSLYIYKSSQNKTSAVYNCRRLISSINSSGGGVDHKTHPDKKGIFYQPLSTTQLLSIKEEYISLW